MTDRVINYYRGRVENGEEADFLWQVGKTVNGKAVSKEHVDIIIDSLASNLQLNKNDVVLDVGCGNGLLTKKVSELVAEVTGLELTSDLYKVAIQKNAAENITYMNDNVLNTDCLINKKFSKIYLYEVLQHIDYCDMEKLFNKLRECSKDGASILMGGVLDAEKIWDFYNTLERRCAYFSGLASGCDPLGVWHHKDYLWCLGDRFGFDVECLSQRNKLYTSHYRFDCILRKK